MSPNEEVANTDIQEIGIIEYTFFDKFIVFKVDSFINTK